MSVDAYRRAIVDRALPFWADRGYDQQRGRFRERLDWTGSPLDLPHRCMVQARQIYVYAHAAELGWYPDGATLAERAMDGLIRHYAEEAGERASFHFSVDGEHRPVSTMRDAYAHAFVLFALAAVYRLNGDAALLRLADRTIAFIDAELTDPVYGGLFDALPLTDDAKRQNPLMHLLEAFLFLEAAAPGRGYLDRAAGIVNLFKLRLFKPVPGILPEYFERDWTARANTSAQLFEPGHHFEWAWLLDRFQTISGTDQGAWIDTLHNVAREHGVTDDGLIFDEVDSGFVPLKRFHRVWPHTEAIKSAVARHGAGDASAHELAEIMAARLLDTFLDRPFPGGWIDHVGEDRTPLLDYVPASSLYHLFLAATETVRLPVRAVAEPSAA